MTYVATANAVRYVGATAVLADCDPHTWTVDPKSVERLLTNKTRAIIAVHLFGVPCPLSALRALAKRCKVALVEDASQAHGALYNGEPVGSWGDIATYSFYGNKILTTGEGGMVCTDDETLARRVRKLRGQGVDPRNAYWFDEIGYNYRMTNLSCAIGLGQLERFDQLRARREEVRGWYERSIEKSGAPLVCQRATPSSRSVHWMFGAVLKRDVPIERDALRTALARSGVETRPFFHPIHSLPPYAKARNDEGCRVSTKLGERGIMLPTHTKLTQADVAKVIESVCRAIPQTACVS